MLITFEGIDGSGKSTQIALLKQALIELGQKAEVFREPGGTQVSELIRAILLNPDLDIDPVSELLLFSASRAQLTAKRVKPLLNEGVIVILDRFYDSTLSYQGYGRESLPVDQIQQLNRIATQDLVPDITFYLRLAPETASNRTQNEQKDRMEQSGDSFFQRVFEGFEALSKQEKRFIIMDANLPIELIHQQILEKVINRLNLQ